MSRFRTVEPARWTIDVLSYRQAGQSSARMSAAVARILQDGVEQRTRSPQHGHDFVERVLRKAVDVAVCDQMMACALLWNCDVAELSAMRMDAGPSVAAGCAVLSIVSPNDAAGQAITTPTHTPSATLLRFHSAPFEPIYAP